MGNKDAVQLPKENQPENQIAQLQIYVIGESYVGKTCLARTYESGEFKENRSLRIGVSRHVRRLKVQNIDTELCIWNVSGQERYRRGIVPFHVRCAEGVLLLYDVANIRSFRKVPIFLQITRKSNPGAIIFIIGGRCDLLDRKEVSRETGQEFAGSENLDFFECSAKTGENVNEVFEYMALRLLQKKGLIPPDKIETLVEGKCLKWNKEQEMSNTSVTEEELVFYGSEKENCNNLQKSFQENDSGMHLEQGLGTLKIIDLSENHNLHSGNEDSHALTGKDGNLSSQSNTKMSSEQNKNCHPSDDKKEAPLIEEKSVLLSEEEIILEGKCPAWSS